MKYKTLWHRTFDNFNPSCEMDRIMDLEPYDFEYGIIKDGTVNLSNHSKTLVLLLGASGCGKTTTSHKICRHYNASIICFDEIFINFFMITGDRNSAIVLASEALDDIMANAISSSNIVVFDGVLLEFLVRLVILRAFKPLFEKIVILFFDVDESEIIYRNLRRGTPITKKVELEISLVKSLKEMPDLLCLGADEVYIGSEFDFE